MTVPEMVRESGVAGGNPPALIERARMARARAVKVPASPGVTPRPSLNDHRGAVSAHNEKSVAGGNPPALIERVTKPSYEEMLSWRRRG